MRSLTRGEITSAYKRNTSLVIAETFTSREPDAVPGCLVKSHGTFARGEACEKAVYHAAVMEFCAKLALMTEKLNANAEPADSYLLDQDYNRKHGENAYYGQEEKR